jgi:ParB family chromosome partitioning protein
VYSWINKKRWLKMVRFESIDPNQIERAPENIRVAAAPIDNLVKSVKVMGVIEPVIVIDKGGGQYRTFVGWRRVEAARQAGVKVPAIIYKENELDVGRRRIWSLAENYERTNLREVDIESAIRELVHDIGSPELVAKAMSWSVGKVRKYLGLEELPPDVKRMTDDGRLTTKDALRLVDLIEKKSDDEITEIAKYMTELKDRKLRAKIPAMAKRGVPVKKIKTEKDVLKFKHRLPLIVDIKIYEALGKATPDLKATDIVDTTERILDLWLGEHGYYS